VLGLLGEDKMGADTYFLWGVVVGIGLCIVNFSIICCFAERLEEWWYRWRKWRRRKN